MAIPNSNKFIINRVLRKLLTLLGIILIISPCLCVSPFAFLFVYRTINRITDFHPVADGIQIAATVYILRVLPLAAEASVASIVQNDVALENTANHAHYSIFKTDYSHGAEYTFLHDQQKTYLMTRRSGLGNNGASIYEIYNVMDMTPIKISGVEGSEKEKEVSQYQSCVDPRLEDHRLNFELVFDCDTYPISPDDPYFYSVPLS